VSDRSVRRAEKSPLLALPSFLALGTLSRPTLEILGEVLGALRNDAAAQGALSWKSRKAPMAAYWIAVAAHVGAAMRALQIPVKPARPCRAVRGPKQRNPVLALQQAACLADVPWSERRRLRDQLARIRTDAMQRADLHWPRSPDEAAYWRAAGVYAGHIRRALACAPVTERQEVLMGL